MQKSNSIDNSSILNDSNEGPVRFGVLGCGHIGKRHALSITGHPEATLVALADIISAKKCDVENYLDGGKTLWYNSLEEMLNPEPTSPESVSPEIPEVICVCTPNGLHVDSAITILQAGCHVVLEKPIALSLFDAKRLKVACDATDKHVFCVMQNRFAPPSKWLKDLVDSGKLGEIRQLHIQCFWNRDDEYYSQKGWRGTLKMDGGPLFTQFSHFVDVMYWIFGGVENLSSRFDNQAHSHNTEFEDSGQINFDLKKGGWGSFTFSTALDRANFESSLTLIAELGTIRIGGQYMEKVVHCDVRDYDLPDLPSPAPPNNYGSYKGSASNHHHVMANVVNVLRNNAPISTPLDEGVEVVRIIEAMYNSGTRPLK